jgi:hypothetical protein
MTVGCNVKTPEPSLPSGDNAVAVGEACWSFPQGLYLGPDKDQTGCKPVYYLVVMGGLAIGGTGCWVLLALHRANIINVGDI